MAIRSTALFTTTSGAALVLLLGACGGSDGGTTLTTTAAAESTTTTTQVDEIPTESSVVVATTITTAPPETTTTAVQAGQGSQLTEAARVSTIGLGPVFVGDLLTTVEEKLGVALVLDETRPVRDACRFFTVPGGPPGVSILAAFDRVARIDIESPSVITTRSGAGIGSTTADIIDLFGERIVVEPGASSAGGDRLAFVPADEKDANLRILFDTNAEGVVVSFRTGQLPEVELAGC